MNNKKEFYRVDFKENEFGMWICGEMTEDKDEAINEYNDKKSNFKGVEILKIIEETLDKYVSENPFLRGDSVEIVKDCALYGQVGWIIGFNELQDEVTVKLNGGITFDGKFEDIIKH